jgi:hypothetical protein
LKALANLVVLIRSGLSTWDLSGRKKRGNHAVRMGMFCGVLAHVPHVRAYSSEFLCSVSRGVFGPNNHEISSQTTYLPA